MGRSKERSKPVNELTEAELVSEKRRCELGIKHSSTLVAKLLSKRLLAIDKRLSREQDSK